MVYCYIIILSYIYNNTCYYYYNTQCDGTIHPWGTKRIQVSRWLLWGHRVNWGRKYCYLNLKLTAAAAFQRRSCNSQSEGNSLPTASSRSQNCKKRRGPLQAAAGFSESRGGNRTADPQFSRTPCSNNKIRTVKSQEGSLMEGGQENEETLRKGKRASSTAVWNLSTASCASAKPNAHPNTRHEE